MQSDSQSRELDNVANLDVPPHDQPDETASAALIEPALARLASFLAPRLRLHKRQTSAMKRYVEALGDGKFDSPLDTDPCRSLCKVTLVAALANLDLNQEIAAGRFFLVQRHFPETGRVTLRHVFEPGALTTKGSGVLRRAFVNWLILVVSRSIGEYLDELDPSFASFFDFDQRPTARVSDSHTMHLFDALRDTLSPSDRKVLDAVRDQITLWPDTAAAIKAAARELNMPVSDVVGVLVNLRLSSGSQRSDWYWSE